MFCLFNAREQQSICQTETLGAKHEVSPVKKNKMYIGVYMCTCVCMYRTETQRIGAKILTMITNIHNYISY